MEFPTISTHDLRSIYNVINAKMNLCMDGMLKAIANEDVERYVFLTDQYNRLKAMRDHYLQKIDILKEILEEVLNIAEEARKI
jgi:hypothetical protein